MHSGQLQDLSPESFQRRIRHNKLILDQLRCLTSASPSEAKNLTLILLQQDILSETRALELGTHLYPVNSIGYGGVVNNFIEALDWLPDADETGLVSRLESFPAQVASYTRLLEAGIEAGLVASVAMVRKVPEQLRAVLKELETKDGALARRGAQIRTETLRQSAEHALSALTPCIQALLNFFVDVYIPRARPGIGCSSLPEGESIYAHCLQYHTTTTMTPAEVHSLGLTEVARIERRYVDDVLAALGFSGSFADFVAAIKSPNSGFYFATESELLQGYTALTARIQSLLPTYFRRLPASPLEIVPMHKASAPAAYYMQGTSDGTRPGRFYVNCSELSARPKYEMPALALHEGIPGHHLQGSLAIENKSIPNCLRFIEDRRYEFCPARRQLYAGYLEGWALYCEYLGEEMGLYTTPYELFGRLSMEMMRAVRLVVDTGIHTQGWTIERAIAYMTEKTGMHHAEVEAECYRYEAWPGQACGYKVVVLLLLLLLQL
jgi:uncharacterized protein (DUF885 family)